MTFLEGALPVAFCPIPVVTDVWDGETYFDGLPSASNSEAILVRGQGTYYPTPGLSLEEVCKLYWGMKRIKLSITDAVWDFTGVGAYGPVFTWALYEDEMLFAYNDDLSTKVCGDPWDSIYTEETVPAPAEALTDYATLGSAVDGPFSSTYGFVKMFEAMEVSGWNILAIVQDAAGKFYPMFQFYLPMEANVVFANDEYPDPNPNDPYLDSKSWFALDSLFAEGWGNAPDNEYSTRLKFFEAEIVPLEDPFLGILLRASDDANQGVPIPEIEEMALTRIAAEL